MLPFWPLATIALGGLLLGAALAAGVSRRAGRAGRAQQARVEAILAHSIDAAYRRDLRTDTYDYLSPALERVMGLPTSELQIMPVQDLIARIHPDDHPRVAAVVDESRRATAGRVEYRFRANTGEYRWIADHWAIELAADGQPAFRSGILRDVSEQKATEAALRTSEARYHMLFDSLEDGFCIVEVLFDDEGQPLDYRFLEANPAFYPSTGLADAIGRTALELIPGLDHWWVRTYGHVALTGEPVRFENYAEAMQRWFDVYAFRFGEPEAGQVAIFFKNVTARKRAELERAALLQREQQARADAERASRLKDDFLATISHELRTPLNAMLGWAQIIARGGADDATIAQGLGAIERNALAQARLIEDLLDMSRIVTGTIRLDVQPVDMRQVIAGAIETARPAAEAKGITIEATIDEDATRVRGDATRLPQVAWNLLSNAVKFTPRGGAVRVRLEGDGADVRLTVADTGQGIASDFLPHVFERFRQADASSTRTHGGLGLGLAIVKQIVELHGGQVSARSDGPDRGSTFVVTLPRQPRAMPEPDLPAAALVAALEVPSSTHEVSLADVTVLAVDDEPDALAVIRRVLEDREARVITATNADEAIALCGRERPHVLLADIGMPVVDGYELIRQVRALGPESGGGVAAAALTAFARSDDRTRALLAGYQTHLAKPVQPIELVAAVASLAGRVTSRGAGTATGDGLQAP